MSPLPPGRTPAPSRSARSGRESAAGALWPYAQENRGHSFWGAVLPVATYVANFVNPSSLGTLIATWSLAVEEQFYVVWPWLVALLLPRGRRYLGAVLLAGIVASAAFRIALFLPENRWPAQAYSQARLDGLSVGGLLALFGPPRAQLTRAVADGARWLGLASFVAFGALVLLSPHLGTWLFYGGFTLVALLSGSMLLATVLARPGDVLYRLLSSRLMVWIGTRSYGLYLFHLPIIKALEMFRRPGDPLNYAFITLLRLALTVAFTEASFRLIERPIREAARRVGRRLTASGS